MPTKYYLHAKLWSKNFCMHFPFLTCVVHATCISHCFISSTSVIFKFMIVSCAKQINNFMTFNRYSICVAVVQRLGKDKDQLLAVSLSKKHIVDHYEVSGKNSYFCEWIRLKNFVCTNYIHSCENFPLLGDMGWVIILQLDKFLGLTIVEMLSWKCHINQILSRLSSACYAIKVITSHVRGYSKNDLLFICTFDNNIRHNFFGETHHTVLIFLRFRNG
jgi:hypothetical protein